MHKVNPVDLIKQISDESKSLVSSHHMLLQVPRRLTGDLHEMFMGSVAAYYSSPEEPLLARKILTGYSGRMTITIPAKSGDPIKWAETQGYAVSHALDYFTAIGQNPGVFTEYDMSQELINNRFLQVNCGLSKTTANLAVSQYQTFRELRSMRTISQTEAAAELLQFVSRQQLVDSHYRRLITGTLNVFFSKVERIEAVLAEGPTFLVFGTRRKSPNGFGNFVSFMLNAEKLRNLELGMENLARMNRKDT